MYCPMSCWLSFYTECFISGFGVIINLASNSSVSLYLITIVFFGFYSFLIFSLEWPEVEVCAKIGDENSDVLDYLLFIMGLLPLLGTWVLPVCITSYLAGSHLGFKMLAWLLLEYETYAWFSGSWYDLWGLWCWSSLWLTRRFPSEVWT